MKDKKEPWAVFDVDGTLLPGASMEKRFLMYMMKKGAMPFKNMFIYFLLGFLKSLSGNRDDAFKENKIYLKDMPSQSLQKFAGRFFRQSLLPRFSPEGLQMLNRYREEGFRIMIMSGSPDFLTKHLVPVFRPDFLVMTVMAEKNGKYTGKIEGLHPYGPRKRTLLQNLAGECGIDFQKSLVFANHHADVLHMELFGKAVAVNPTARLQKIARERNWEIVFWN